MCKGTREFGWTPQNPELQGKETCYNENNVSNGHNEDISPSCTDLLFQLSSLKNIIVVHEKQVDMSYLSSGNCCLIVTIDRYSL